MMTPLKKRELTSRYTIMNGLHPVIYLYPMCPRLNPGVGQDWRMARPQIIERRFWI